MHYAPLPRDPRQPILTKQLIGQLFLVAILMVAGGLAVFHWEQSRGVSLEAVRTSVVNLIDRHGRGLLSLEPPLTGPSRVTNWSVQLPMGLSGSGGNDRTPASMYFDSGDESPVSYYLAGLEALDSDHSNRACNSRNRWNREVA